MKSSSSTPPETKQDAVDVDAVDPAYVDPGPPSKWSVTQWHDVRLDQAFPMLGRGGALKIKQHASIPNRVAPLMDLIDQSSLTAVFNEHIGPFITADTYKARKTRSALIQTQIEAAFAAYSALSAEDKLRSVAEAELKTEKKKEKFGQCTWPIWSSPLCEIFRYLSPSQVNEMMKVCSHWKREAERNRIWRPLVIRYYPREKLEVEDATSHAYRRWRSRWLALKQYSRVAVKISFGKSGSEDRSMEAKNDIALFDHGQLVGH